MTERAATTGQISFLRDLVREMRGEEAVEQAVAWAWGAGFDATSQQIDRLKAERAARRRKQDGATFERASVKPWQPVGEGFYSYEGQIVKVVASPYARNRFGLTVKTLNPDLGVWELAAPLLRLLKPEHKLTLEQAQEFGRLTGRCCRCAAMLTDDESIARGLGPICMTKF
jgi:hypothetical protein